MLDELTIKNLGVVADAKFTPAAGLTVITGETGAGKTIVLTALSLLRGDRAKTSLVRPGETLTQLHSTWSLTEAQQELFEKENISIEDGELYSSRTLTSAGKSKSTLGGAPLPSSVIQNMTNNLIVIHGQADQRALRDPAIQLLKIDRFCDSKELTKAQEPYKAKYSAWVEAKKKFKKFEANQEANRLEYYSLLAFTEDFNSLEPQPNELEDCKKTVDETSHLEEIKTLVQEIGGLLSPDSYEVVAPEQQLRTALKELNSLAGYSPDAELIRDKLSQTIQLLGETIDELESYSNRVDLFDLDKLYAAEDRLRELTAFEKKYKDTIENLTLRALAAESRIKEIDPEVNNVEIVKEELDKAHKELVEAGTKLSLIRTTAAKNLSDKVNKELRDLAMRGTVFSIALNKTNYGPTGCDEIAMLIALPGGTPNPIASSASGGELSRIMLALEVVLAADSDDMTFIFDEVDAGVGGSTAIEIGKKLAKLSVSNQVILVSHLAQVAVFADAHWKVEKTPSTNSVITTLTESTGQDRIKEITRLLSGLEGSSSGQTHATELLGVAATFKAQL